ncbi:MAG: hypothetical protein KC609_25775, partial [Myxococcales bacterium]|nr:hypothetical protein [Myxococcales bacterium]
MRDWKALSHLVLMAIVVLALTACTGTRKKKYGQLCQDDGSCPSGALCVDGRCAALQSCQSSNDCAVGVCSEGYCWTESCTSDSQCPATLQCLEGYCIRSAETVDARDTSGEDQQTTNDQGTEKQCDVDSDCDGKVSGLGACEEVACTSGQCGKRNKPKDSTCDDQNPCTGDDKCDDKGVCQPGANVCECQKDADCTKLDDSCNKGVCNLDSHGCEKSPINEGNSCDDGNECTVTDTCKSGVCAGNPSFGASCGDGVNRHCDFYGACIEWLESTLSAPASPMSDSCTTASDCPNGGMGYSCTDGLCLCTDSNGCTCALDTGDVCSEGQVCLIRDSQQVPGDKTYRCSYQSMRQAAVCRIRESGKSDTLYLLGINFFEDFQPTTGTFDAVFDRMENGLSVETQVPQTELGLYYSNATMLCSGGVGGVSISGEGYYLYPFKLDSQKTWQPMDGLYETLSGIGGQTDNVYGSIFALQSLTLADQRIVTYWGGYLRASSLLGPGDVDPRSHEDFLVRCIENSGSSTGFDCEPRFLELHD